MYLLKPIILFIESVIFFVIFCCNLGKCNTGFFVYNLVQSISVALFAFIHTYVHCT